MLFHMCLPQDRLWMFQLQLENDLVSAEKNGDQWRCGGKCVETLAYPLHPLHDPVQGGIDHRGLRIGMAISFSSVGRLTDIVIRRSVRRYLGNGSQSESP